MNIIRHCAWITSKHRLTASQFANPGFPKLKKKMFIVLGCSV